MNEKKWEQENVLRLVKKSRKGVLRVVFSRFGLMALLLILELVLLWMMWRWFNNDFEWFAAVQGVFTVLMFFHLFNSDMDATGKLTWMFLLAVIPIPASIFLWFTEKDVGHRTLKRMVQQRIDESRDLLHQDPEVLRDPEIESSGTDDLCRYLNRSGSFPLYANTETRFFPQGEDKFAALLEELQKAEKFIFLEYFIIDEGYMWGSILKILADKAAQGVDVRVLYDGMLEISTLPWDYPRRLEKLGIRCKAFAPIQPFLSTHYNYRDHRKILVIDGKVAFTGGVNLADEYINRKERFGHWKDTAILLRGEAVQSFTLMFLQMWNLTEKEPRWDEALLPSPPVETEGYVMPYCDCPLDDYKVGESVYMDILNRAKDYVHIMTPYLILDNEMETALKFAAQRGVDVKLILPGIPDKKAAYALAKSHYQYLTAAGVKLYEYTPGFVHAKIFASDDVKAVVGTINLDYRSLYHHFENGCFMVDCPAVDEIKRDFKHTFSQCREVTEKYKAGLGAHLRLGQLILRLFAQLM